MVSSKSFEGDVASLEKTGGAAAVADRSRFRGARGGIITMHRSMARFRLSPLDLITAMATVVLLTFVWLISLRWICNFWRMVLARGSQMLALDAVLAAREHHVTSYISFVIPYPRIHSPFPDATIWWLTLAVVCVLLAATFILPDNWIPVKYIARIILFVQATALFYFLLIPARFPISPDSYLEGLALYGTTLISFVPTLFGMTYYIFHYGLLKKAFLTALTMAYLSIFFPLQILFQALVLEKSIVYMPLLYIVFGLPMEVLIIICLYSWGSSWAVKGDPARF